MHMMSRNLQATTNAYTACLTTLGEDATDRELFACVASGITVYDRNQDYARSIFLVYAGTMVFLMQVRGLFYLLWFIASCHVWYTNLCLFLKL